MSWKKIKNDLQGIGILILMLLGVILLWFISSIRFTF